MGKLLQQVRGKRSDKHFQDQYSKIKYYTTIINRILEENSIPVEIELDLKKNRNSNKKVMFGGSSIDEVV